jgi:XTP/dITP diphosphohydrolase
VQAGGKVDLMRLVLASNNAKKLAEMRALFHGLTLEIVTQGELGIGEAQEPFGSFIENALAKARHAAQASGGAALADDSGLCVPALGGEPGVASAHYAALPALAPAARPSTTGAGGAGGAGNTGSTTALLASVDRESLRRQQDAANNALLLERLQGHADRRAYFVSTLVALRHATDPEPLIATARWQGTLLEQARGQGGFGYDPLLWIADCGCSVAELDAARKNALSHRAQASAQMHQLLAQVWGL